jgi:hypothetical protein
MLEPECSSLPDRPLIRLGCPCVRDEWPEPVPTSISGHRLFPQGKFQEILAGIGAVIDAVGATSQMHYTAVAVTEAVTWLPLPGRWAVGCLRHAPPRTSQPSDREHFAPRTYTGPAGDAS